MAKANKTAAKSGNTQENAIAAANSSNYNTLIPLRDVCGVYVKHPLNSKTIRVDTYSDAFLAVFRELTDLGLGARLMRELGEFAAKHDPRWSEVATWVEGALTPAAEETAAEVVAEA